MKAYLAIPSYDAKITSSCAQSLVKAAVICANAGIEIQPFFTQGGIFIDHVRSLVVRKFLETDCTHLFFIDADLGFESDAIAGLMLSGFPVTAGIYTKRSKDLLFNGTAHEPQELKDGWLRMKRVATGFLCIERSVLEEMSKRAQIIQAW